MKCHNCGADSGNRFCPFCGCEMPQRERGGFTFNDNSNNKVVNNYFYTNTNEIPGNMNYGRRPYHGRNNAYEDCSDKSMTIAWIICLFFGMFGGHYFYVGRSGMGIVFLFTAGGFGIGWMYDLYRILAGRFFDNNGYYLMR